MNRPFAFLNKFHIYVQFALRISTYSAILEAIDVNTHMLLWLEIRNTIFKGYHHEKGCYNCIDLDIDIKFYCDLDVDLYLVFRA